MNNRTVITANTSQGFSLVELMVGLVVGMITVLAILQSLSLFEGQKRTTVSGADAQESGLMATYMLERDARMTGNSMLFSAINASALACTQVNSWAPATDTNPGAVRAGVNFLPISIADGGGVNPDTLVFRYGRGGSGGASGRLVVPVANSNPATPLLLYNAAGFQVGDDILISQPGTNLPCSRLRITSIDDTTNPNVAQVLHANGTGENSKYNPPAANNIFPTTPAFQNNGYAAEARVFNAGSMAENTYCLGSAPIANNFTCPVDGANADTLVLIDANPTPSPVADNIVNLQAQYGIAAVGGSTVSCWVNATNPGTPATCDAGDWAFPNPANARRIRAVRIAVVARSPLQERDPISLGTDPGANVRPVCYPCGSDVAWRLLGGSVTGSLTDDQRRFRYKTYETLVPSRNLVWVNPQ